MASSMSCAMLSVPIAMLQPAAARAWMGGAAARRAAIAALWDTEARLRPRCEISPGDMKRQCAATRRDERKPCWKRYSAGRTPRTPHDRRHLPVTLVEVDRGAHVAPLGQLARPAQQLR